MTEPILPRLSDFGLTEERLAFLDEGPGMGQFWSLLPVPVVAGAISWALTGSVGFTILGVLVLSMIGFVVAGSLLMGSVEGYRERWYASQPDTAAWRDYHRAIRDYEAIRATWLRTQQNLVALLGAVSL